MVLVDNQSAIAIAANVGYTARAKHIDIRHRFVRDHVQAATVSLQYVPTSDQLADYMTKPLSQKRFDDLRTRSGVRASRMRGCVVAMQAPDSLRAWSTRADTRGRYQ